MNYIAFAAGFGGMVMMFALGYLIGKEVGSRRVGMEVWYRAIKYANSVWRQHILNELNVYTQPPQELRESE